jgi:nicotinamidase-related amidase
MKNFSKIGYVIDMVNGFVYEGAMHDDYIAHTIDEQVRLIKTLKAENQGVALIGEWHNADCSEFFVYPAHCVKGTSEAEFVDGIKEFENDSLVYKKNSTNGIFAPGLLNDLNEMKNLKEIIVCGCCTDICVLHFVLSIKTYLNQMNRDVKVFVVESATETYDAPNHNRDEYNEIGYRLMKQNGVYVVKDLKELKEKENALGLNTSRRTR